jgi:hypothetical protein
MRHERFFKKLPDSPLAAIKVIADRMVEFFHDIRNSIEKSKQEIDSLASRAEQKDSVGHLFLNDLLVNERKKIQDTINELRFLISESTLFDPAHRVRLLGRLEKLQSGLHDCPEPFVKRLMEFL